MKIKQKKLELEARYPTKSTKEETEETDVIEQIANQSDKIAKQIARIREQYAYDPEMAEAVIENLKRTLVEKRILGGDDV